jgi:hypothetical protein
MAIYSNPQNNESDNTAIEGIKTNVYPNPFTNQFNIEFTSAIERAVVVELFDLIGNKVSEQKEMVSEGSSLVNFSTDELTKGIYLLRVFDLNGNILCKQPIVKQ